MKKFSGSLARRYGTAFFDCVIDSIKKNNSIKIESFIEFSHKMLSVFNKDIVALFSNPALVSSQKKELLLDVLKNIESNDSKCPKLINDFLIVMIDNDRFEVLESTLKYFLQIVDDYLGIKRAILVTANKVTNESEAEFKNLLSTSLNKKIVLESKVDPALRSGFIIKLGNTSVDASLRTRLLNLKESLS